jgi:twitching motility protein PilT
MLTLTLEGFIGQRLIRSKGGEGRVAACEIMVTTGRIKDFVMDPDQTGQIQTAIAEASITGCRPSTKPS